MGWAIPRKPGSPAEALTEEVEPPGARSAGLLSPWGWGGVRLLQDRLLSGQGNWGTQQAWLSSQLPLHWEGAGAPAGLD